ncbi:hypothetical protein Hgul01_02020 [Herpetosiphon gulosus]|uniref:Uncharacterized protein n=1 Tax=Herpetosiphon gulosus TaxID=1973496 RepID=A0ABP9X074_9CHLR
MIAHHMCWVLFVPSPPSPLSRPAGGGKHWIMTIGSPLARRRGRGVGGEGMLAGFKNLPTQEIKAP